MNWPLSFCVVGSFGCVAFIIGRYTEFKKYHMDEVVKALDRLERDVKKLKGTV